MKNIEDLFCDMLSELELTSTQKGDAKTKYQGVIDCLAHHFYERRWTENDKYLFGSYKTKTAIRPLDKGSDVDVLFKISEDIYEKYKENPGGLLQEIRKALKDKYTTTEAIKAWGKVVLVQFSDNHHNVEVLPAFENDDCTFKIPNTANGGSWEKSFNPRSQINLFNISNTNTSELTRELTMIVKRWVRNTNTLYYKSYLVVEDVIEFCNSLYCKGRGDTPFDQVVTDYFTYMKSHQGKQHRKNILSYLETAHTRATKALQLRKEGKYIKASEEWNKVFGEKFKLATEDALQQTEARMFTQAASPWYA